MYDGMKLNTHNYDQMIDIVYSSNTFCFETANCLTSSLRRLPRRHYHKLRSIYLDFEYDDSDLRGSNRRTRFSAHDWSLCCHLLSKCQKLQRFYINATHYSNVISAWHSPDRHGRPSTNVKEVVLDPLMEVRAAEFVVFHISNVDLDSTIGETPFQLKRVNEQKIWYEL